MPNYFKYLIYLLHEGTVPFIYSSRRFINKSVHKLFVKLYAEVSKIKPGSLMSYSEWQERNKWIEIARAKSHNTMSETLDSLKTNPQAYSIVLSDMASNRHHIDKYGFGK